MPSIGSVGGNVMNSPAVIQARISVAALKKQKDVVNQMGDMALKLVQSASIDPNVGSRINLQA